MAHGHPPAHWAFSSRATLDVPARFVLELTDGLVVGDYGVVVTWDGMLDYETSNYFGINGWREHPVFLRPVLPRPQHVLGTMLNLTTRGTSVNYYHFLFDALPRYGILREALPDVCVDAVLVPHRTRYQQQLLGMLGVDAPLLQPADDLSWRADRLLVPSTPNHELAAPSWVVDWLRRTLRPTSPVSPGRRRLYVTRGDQRNTRRYVHEPVLWPELERRGFERIDPGSRTVQEQIDLFDSAEIVVGPHGAGLANLVFCRPGTKVVEMFAADYVHMGLWNITHSIPDMDYRYLVSPGAVREGGRMAGVLSDVRVDPGLVLETIDELLG
jgi:capsular polysaccharide biosynthesis protein